MNKSIILISAILFSNATMSFAADKGKFNTDSLQMAKKMLLKHLNETESLIKEEEDNQKELIKLWNRTCMDYLKQEYQDADELEALLRHTIPEIDGKDLYDRLAMALKKEKADNKSAQGTKIKGSETEKPHTEVPDNGEMYPPISAENKQKDGGTKPGGDETEKTKGTSKKGVSKDAISQ